MSHYFVLWSGGLDSTFLIHHLLSQGHKVTTGYIELKNNEAQVKRELNAISKLLPYFENKYGTEKIKYLNKLLSLDILQSSNVILKQAIVWTSVIYTVPNECDYIALGYVMGDCAISYIDDIRAAFNGFSGLVYRSIPPTFPIMKYNKEEIWKDIPIELQQYVTWCESDSENDKCGFCTSCKRMINDGLYTLPKVKTHKLSSPGVSVTIDDKNLSDYE